MARYNDMVRHCVTVPLYARYALMQAGLSSRSSFQNSATPPLDEDAAMEYFRDHADKQTLPSLVDASSTKWYTRPLACSSLLRNSIKQSDRRIMDLACGSGGLLPWLKEHANKDLRYVGIDQNPSAIKRCQQLYGSPYVFIDGDIRNLNHVYNHADIDVFFLINILPYIANPLSIMEACRELARSRNSLLVMLDPHPSAFWSATLGESGICIRDHDTLIEMAENAGWEAKEHCVLSITRVLNIPVFPLASALVCTLSRQHKK